MFLRYSAGSSALARPLHQLQGRFDAPPCFGLFLFASLFAGTSLLRGFSDGLVTVRFEQLPRIVLDVDFLHSHGVMLLLLDAIRQSRPRTIDVDTRWRPAICILACRKGKIC